MRYRGPAELTVVRHGQSAFNAALAAAARGGGRLDAADLPARNADVDLTPLGVRQARAVGSGWLASLPGDRRPGVVFSSTYLRARRTAALALEAAGLVLPVHLDERLRDYDGGPFTFMTPAMVEEYDPEEAPRRLADRMHHRPERGESLADVLLRLRSFLRDLCAEYPGERVLLFAHEPVVVLLRGILEDLEEDEVWRTSRREPAAAASVSRWTADAGGDLRPDGYGAVGHLSGVSAGE
ncbi:histidine phosphatase family protein [Nocardiopsis dassonvillei]|uniref:phosphoglycerate mutase (2,3-diphosphoglycerate-dependent) n=1 Tax=Nocardiopsis dassonvillei (strain ATCC 23218 / DSM 43111 / CIP 107115 / JCM 7437 / KCTC 9190 / NBRC 14626 / NCTC 10488 / NRRL B-5397 / IMRU 509) TaxID=446468 RepID=D7B870_NOCDD|nr:histidine phosphatase family protein [Nocardiopsis dassonvillei]ADH70378.1 Phosphoglycerate mutase [Nocardiopsis dassonvillei subsp. dassonvillei DSM 43111]NKY77010.1 histidine phosphatase family protein [Nocardiopsis dassonvillei]VEI91287.1 Phosphoglyceromutase [Nocardiopsis dassonvillei]